MRSHVFKFLREKQDDALDLKDFQFRYVVVSLFSSIFSAGWYIYF